MNEWTKVFGEFIDKVDQRLRAMRADLRNELLAELRAEVGPGERGDVGPRGEVGPKGEKGDQGPSGEKGEPGPRGEPGEMGASGPLGPAGKDGVGVASGKLDEGRLVLVLTDGSEKSVGRVVGEPGAPGPQGEKGIDGKDGVDGKDGAPGPRGEKGVDGKDGERGPTGPQGEKGAPGIEGKDGAPGRDGRDGAPGAKGDPGKDGRDGLTEEQVDKRIAALFRDATLDGRTLTIAGRTFRMPGFVDRGVWKEGDEYEAGDAVSWGSSLWIAQKKTTEKPGDGDTAWRLAVKKGRDGRDLRTE